MPFLANCTVQRVKHIDAWANHSHRCPLPACRCHSPPGWCRPPKAEGAGTGALSVIDLAAFRKDSGAVHNPQGAVCQEWGTAKW